MLRNWCLEGYAFLRMFSLLYSLHAPATPKRAKLLNENYKVRSSPSHLKRLAICSVKEHRQKESVSRSTTGFYF